MSGPDPKVRHDHTEPRPGCRCAERQRLAQDVTPAESAEFARFFGALADPKVDELTEVEVGRLLSAAFHALGTHRLSGHTDELERRLRDAASGIIAARVAAVVEPVLALADEVATVGITCECGHYVGGDHNGRGCYAVVTYSPLVRCSCTKTDAQDEAEIVAARICAAIESTDAPAALARIKAEERERIATELANWQFPDPDEARPHREYRALLLERLHRFVGTLRATSREAEAGGPS